VVCGPGLLASCIVSRPGPRAAPRGCLCPARPATVLVSPAAPARAGSSYCPAPPAAQAGRMAACRYIMTARQPGRRSKRKPGWRATWCCRRAPAARPPTAVVSPAPGRPATRAKIIAGAGCCPALPACDCPNGESR